MITPIDLVALIDVTLIIVMSRLTLMVSELSALAGRHRYKPREQAVIHHLLSYEKDWCASARRRYLETKAKCCKLASVIGVPLSVEHPYSAQLAELSARHPEVMVEPVSRAEVEALASTRTSKVEKQSQQYEDALTTARLQVDLGASDETVKAQLATVLPPEVKPCVAFGSLAESKGLQTLQTSLINSGWTLDPVTTGRRRVFSVGPFEVTCYGKVDALYRQGDQVMIVENKNRKNRLFSTPPSYDLDQLALYVSIWGADQGLLHQYHDRMGDILIVSKAELEARTQHILNSKELLQSVQEIQDYLYERRDASRFVEEHLMEEK